MWITIQNLKSIQFKLSELSHGQITSKLHVTGSYFYEAQSYFKKYALMHSNALIWNIFIFIRSSYLYWTVCWGEGQKQLKYRHTKTAWGLQKLVMETREYFYLISLFYYKETRKYNCYVPFKALSPFLMWFPLICWVMLATLWRNSTLLYLSLSTYCVPFELGF